MVQKQKRVETVSAGASITALSAVQCRAVPDLCDVARRSFPQVLLDRSNGNCASLHQRHYCWWKETAVLCTSGDNLFGNSNGNCASLHQRHYCWWKETAVLCTSGDNLFGNSNGNCGSLHQRHYCWWKQTAVLCTRDTIDDESKLRFSAPLRENLFGNSNGNCGSLHQKHHRWWKQRLRFSAPKTIVLVTRMETVVLCTRDTIVDESKLIFLPERIFLVTRMGTAVLCIRENIFGNSIGNCGSLHQKQQSASIART